ncbi:MAG: peptide chain release factor N(5)-glutamine methyltransferase [Flavobacteriales bacterium]|nr:peptide chain release factor N(5)-glutamine methyltransferase [Flavobacteriales bacterium]
MKISNNKLSSVRTYFFETLSKFEESDVKSYFEYLCDAWLGLSKIDIRLNPDVEITESELLSFFYGIKDLLNYRPVQYVAGKSWFYGLEIGVREGVLIPRPETEELVDWIVKENLTAQNVFEIGTGSGCIPLAIKSNLKKATVFAGDISEEALLIAESNAKVLNLKVNFQRFDALNWQEFKFEQKFDVIVSNPPYIPNSDKTLMHKNVLDFEPGLALFVANESPLLFYEKIADFALENLSESGALYFEIHERFGSETIKMLKVKGFLNVFLRQDLQGKDRMLKATIN